MFADTKIAHCVKSSPGLFKKKKKKKILRARLVADDVMHTVFICLKLSDSLGTQRRAYLLSKKYENLKSLSGDMSL